MDWIKYSEQRPESAGIYEWRMESSACPGLMITLHEYYRERWAGYQKVLSPAFDGWDGYHVLVPEELEWRPATEFQDKPTYFSFPVIPEGVDLDPCPFCKEIPVWKSFSVYPYSMGLVEPQRINLWGLECCKWSGSPKMTNPKELAKERHKLLFG